MMTVRQHAVLSRIPHPVRAAGDDDCQWITSNTGVHICIDEKTGKVMKGPKDLVDKEVAPSWKGKQGRSGSWKNPIACGDDIDKAAKLISEGKHVTLNQPDQVSTLVDKIAREAEEAKARGEVPKNWNLADITVKGTNLFAVHSLGIARVDMPQMSGVPVPGSKGAKLQSKPGDEIDLTQHFIKSLKEEGIEVKGMRMLASHLRGTQGEIDGAKVASMVSAMDAGKVREQPIFVTREGYVLDGHHRWAGIIVRDIRDNKPGDLDLPVFQLDIDIGTALTKSLKFQNDWGIAGKGPTT